MAGDVTLAQIDAHMQRGNELLARIDEHLERGIKDFSDEHLAHGAAFEVRIAEHITRCEDVIAATGTSYDEWRYVLRQDSLRNERVLGEMSQSLARNTEKTDNFVAESKAYRKALWAILDQLRGDESPEAGPG
ncbi:MAG TPA: hypothetical protein VHZ31_09530 [Solirubrobacteraceae bacterium]|jgi:hypothetical protein|nr:hypothetical protein [Solirubrobacteraceae bacterium]